MLSKPPGELQWVRPTMAWRSFSFATLYILMAEAAHIISVAWGGSLPGADVAIAGILYSPCGVWMAMRTVDGFSQSGKSETGTTE